MKKALLAVLTVFTLALTAQAESTDKIVLAADAAQHYVCENGKTATAQYFNATDDSGVSIVKLTLDTETYYLPTVRSASGARYSDLHQIEWWTKNDEASLDYDINSDDKTTETSCKVKP